MIKQQTNKNGSKFYSLKQILLGTFIFGPFAGLYYLYKNIKLVSLNEDQKLGFKRWQFFWILLLSINVLITIILKTDAGILASIIISIINVLVVYKMFILYIENKISYKENNSQFSRLNVLGIGIVYAIILLFYVFLLSVIGSSFI